VAMPVIVPGRSGDTRATSGAFLTPWGIP
jgi:hypothetical protein